MIIFNTQKIFILLNILAMLTYPGTTLHDKSSIGYSFTNNFLSDLGRFISWSGEQNFYSNLFFILQIVLRLMMLELILFVKL